MAFTVEDVILRLVFVLLAWAAILARGVAAAPTRPAAAPRAASPALPTTRLFGVDYVDARVVATRFGLKPVWLEAGKTLRLYSQWTRIEFTVHRGELMLNGTRLVLAQPVAAAHGSLYLGEGDVTHVLTPILSPRSSGPGRRVRTIVVDAGHGGEDPGKQNRALKLDEKKFTLDVAKRLEKLLKKEGYRVVMTRTGDRTVELDRRVEIAQRANADLFVSIHFNAFSDARVSGAETFVMTPWREPSSPARESDTRMPATRYPGNRYDPWNSILGYHVHRQVVGRSKAVDRGLKHFRYHVLRSVECPGVLVEAAFISNSAEAKQIAGTTYRQNLAESIAEGVKAYAAAVGGRG